MEVLKDMSKLLNIFQLTQHMFRPNISSILLDKKLEMDILNSFQHMIQLSIQPYQKDNLFSNT
jgi:hypothetical protein